MVFRNTLILLSLSSLAACGSGSGSNDVIQEPVEDLPTIIGEGISARSESERDVVRWRDWSDGSKRLWSGKLHWTENGTLVEGTSIVNLNSSAQIEEGYRSGNYMISVDVPEAPTVVPTGSANYSGEAIMLIDTWSEMDDDITISKLASASMSIDFEEGEGEINVVSNDGQSQITADVINYYGTLLEGDGTFTFVDDTYEDFSESTAFDGTLTGSSGEGAAGIFVGNRHAVGISLE